MDVIIILLSLSLLILMAYKGYSVILFAPIAALLAVLLTDPANVLPFYTGIFMPKMVGFIGNYFPIFLLGAVFGKVIELSGIAAVIAKALIRWIGKKQVILTVVLLGGILTFSGISLFVAVFAVYPFAKQLFIQADIPKRLMPAAIALGSFTFTMDAIPGTPQIQNIIPTRFFGTDIYAAPVLGIIGGLFVLGVGLLYLEWRKRTAMAKGEGYFGFGEEAEIAKKAEEAKGEEAVDLESKDSALRVFLAFVPLLLVFVINLWLTKSLPNMYPNGFDFAALGLEGYSVDVKAVSPSWAVMCGLVVGIITAYLYNYKQVQSRIKDGLTAAIAGSLLAVMNTGSEFGFGGVIASLPGFPLIQEGISHVFSNPLMNGAVTTTVLAGVTGSASGGMSIALGVMGDEYNRMIAENNIPPEVMHRVVSMASGGMDTLPHNGAVITLLAVTGLTHKQSYGDIFMITVIKTVAFLLAIALYTFFGIV